MTLPSSLGNKSETPSQFIIIMIIIIKVKKDWGVEENIFNNLSNKRTEMED